MATQQPVPVYTNLDQLYASLGTAANHAQRWSHLIEEFEKRFGRKPAYIARAPGRVNIIGEHIDYCLFSVLPAAVESDILIACAPRQTGSDHGHVNAENLHPKYARQAFAPLKGRRQSISQIADEEVHAEEWDLDINTKELRWESYVKAGYFGVLNHYFAAGADGHPTPVDLLVTGTVPAGSGLSSSAAMVVASTLAFLAVNGKLEDNLKGSGNPISKGQLVKMAVENESRVGVNSGGMDQAASVVSNPSSALFISFFPKLAAEPVPLPPGAALVIANSLVVSDKAVTAKTNYNLRVVETLAASRILAKHLNLSVGPKEKIQLREVVSRYAGEGEDEMTPEKLEENIKKVLGEIDVLKPKEQIGEQLGVTLDEMIEKTGLGKTEFEDIYLSWVEVEATHFQLYKRAKHVFEEALRVLSFRSLCLSAANANWSSDTYKKLGSIMNESQESCRTQYQCTCPEIDLLTELARDAGAVGSRVTGAGWGGCTVSMVAERDVDGFIKEVTAGYEKYHGLDEDRLKEVIFATKPSSGAAVFKFTE